MALLFTGRRPLPSPLLITAILLLLLLAVLVRVQRPAGGSGGDGVESNPVSGPGLNSKGLNSKGLNGTALKNAAFGFPALMAIAVIATGLGATLPVTSSGHRVDLRERYNPPVQIAQGITPLALLQSQLNSTSTTPLFTVRFQGVPAGVKIDQVPVAVLDTYDGAVWGTNASFAVAGRQLPSGPSAPQAGPVIQQDYQIGRYGLSFLPALGRPIRTTGTHLAFDRVSGMLATATPAPAGFKYSVDSEVPDLSQVASAPVTPGNDPNFATLALASPAGLAQDHHRLRQQVLGPDALRHAATHRQRAAVERLRVQQEGPAGPQPRVAQRLPDRADGLLAGDDRPRRFRRAVRRRLRRPGPGQGLPVGGRRRLPGQPGGGAPRASPSPCYPGRFTPGWR